MTPASVLSDREFGRSGWVADWNDLAVAVMAALSARSDETPSLGIQGKCADVGKLRAIEISASDFPVNRALFQVGRGAESYFLLELLLEGKAVTRQGWREAQLEPGDFTLCDTRRPFEICIESPTRLLVLKIPRPTLNQYLWRPEMLVAIPMAQSVSANWLTSRFLQQLWVTAGVAFQSPAVMHLTSAALQMLAQAYCELSDAHSDTRISTSVQRARILEYIEGHLESPSMTPSSIAAALKISSRYLHRVWKSDHGTVARYILRRRLEQSALMLSNPTQRTRSITSIALHWGFSGAPQFCTAFRSCYGVTPVNIGNNGRACP